MPSSKTAKRVFKGEIFDVYQWRQKMFDGSYKIFERVKRSDTVIVIATIGSKVVVLKQKQPGTKWFYSTPSGRMDVPGEKPKFAAKRELLEETGMVAGSFKLWKKQKVESGKVEHVRYFYIATNCRKVTEQKLDAGEKIQVLYFSFDEFLKLSDHPQSPTWLSGMLVDMFRARLDRKYKNQLSKIIFGKIKI